ncbi:MAG: hypothetical protein PW735_11580 [Acidobacteriaceae bacterium]|nr:hypothetical protein [Acidobacteriaceae bacterium]
MGTRGLTVRLPLLSFAQRGTLHFGVIFSYDTPIFKYKETCKPNGPGADPTCMSTWIVPGNTEQIRALSTDAAFIRGAWNPGWMVTITDGQQGSHIAVPVTNSLGNVYATVDGSGMVGSFTVQNGGANGQQFAVAPSWVIDANGVKTTVAADGTERIEDSNGNFLSYGVVNSSTVITDTMGRTYDENQELLNGASDPSCGTNGASSIITYPGPNGQPAQIKACKTPVSVLVNFDGTDKDGDQIREASGTIYPVTSVSLYDGKSWSTSPTWKFDYNNSLGNLTKITLPGGGSIAYEWESVPVFSYAPPLGSAFMTQAITKRTVDPGDGSPIQSDTYDSRTITNALGDVSQHTITGFGGPPAYVTDATYTDHSFGLLKTEHTDYMSSYYLDLDEYKKPINVFPTRVTTSLPDASGTVSKVEYEYDNKLNQSGASSYGKLITTRKYDVGNSSPGALIQCSQNEYEAFQVGTYMTANLLNLTSSSSTYAGDCGGDSLSAYQSTQYDESTLISSGVSTQRDSSGGTVRGNATTKTNWLNTTSGNLVTHTSYFDTGLTQSSTDAMSNSTIYEVNPSEGGAFITKVTRPTTNSVQHISTIGHDLVTGATTSSIDENTNPTTTTFDALGRPQEIVSPDGGDVQITYDPDFLTVHRRVKMNSGTWMQTDTLYDGLGRKSRVATLLPGGSYLQVDYCYDAANHLQFQSNPFTGSGFGSAKVCSGAGDSFTTDFLGNVRLVQHADGSTVITNVSGATTTTTDESGVSWSRTTDGLGRLVKVIEHGSQLDPHNLETEYVYDALNNLTQVTQKGTSTETPVQRSFTYDSLSRLITSINPEVGTICYGQWVATSCTGGYDANSNLLYKTDARGIVSHFLYDNLNRLTAKIYSDGTPSVAFAYDTSSVPGAANTIGRVTQETVSNGAITLSQLTPYAYDAMGRIKQLIECTPANCPAPNAPYHLALSYDLAGNIIESTNGIPAAVFTGDPADPSSNYGNPSATFNGIPVPSVLLTSGYDSAGRLSHLTSSWADTGNHPGTLFQATSIDAAAPAYGPAGLENAQFGINSATSTATVSMARAYDSRLRLASETDTGTVPAAISATGSSGSITILGSEQPITAPATPGTATVTISGTEGSTGCGGGVVVQSAENVTQSSSEAQSQQAECTVTYDTGSVSVTVNGFTAVALYRRYSTSVTVASALAAALNSSGSPVSATSSGSVVTMTSIATGEASNYAFSISNGADFWGLASGASLEGGGVGAISGYDAGTISVTVNGINVSIPWGSSSTPQSLASALAASLQSAGSSIFTATASGQEITLHSNAVGLTTNWPISVVVSDSSPTEPASFSASVSGMAGGADGIAQSTVLYSYTIPATGGFAPNGNLLNVQDSVMGNWTYGYDGLNRLISAFAYSGTYVGSNIAGATLGWSYDSFGNRLLQSSNFAGFPTGSVQFAGANNRAVGIGLASVPASSVDTMQYDAAGNLTGKNGITSSLYDAEGRLCAIANETGGFTQYIYDGNGNRVAKGPISVFSCNVSNNGFSPMVSYVLDTDGKQLTEFNLSSGQWGWAHSNVFASTGLVATYSNPASGSETTFALNDWLGTKRVEVTPDGKVSSFASLPFGDGLTSSGSASDATEHHFTGKERDAESGLDYFGARYYGSSMGRFMSPDWSKTPEGVPYADLSNPQSLNLYGYVLNNPLSKTDADGHWPDCSVCQTVINWLSSSHSSSASANGSLGQGSASNGSLSASARAATGSASASASYGANTSVGAKVSGSVASATVNEGTHSTTQMDGLTANAGANVGASVGGGKGVQVGAGASANADVLSASQTEKITIGPVTITGSATGAVGVGANASASVGTNGVSASAGVTPGVGGSLSLSVTWNGVSGSGGATSNSNFQGTTNKINQPVIKPQP